ncbi:T-complex protein 1 subunit beta [Culex quinquefasciatus]|uniref:T-complex protein 1 subunit beta n=1 Tax=Culex quinquefasciatus TaxID=7176 RepID=UPI0018E39501|nr:T-complex protein 1 subunit beta [Culex quinquefasciatus]
MKKKQSKNCDFLSTTGKVCSEVIARLSSFVGAIAIGNLVKSTLGPEGMDKILIAHGRSAGRLRSPTTGLDFEGGRRKHESLSGRRGWRWNDFRDGVGVRVAAMLSEAEKLLEQKFPPQTSAAKQAPKLFAGCCLEDSFLDKGFLLDKKTVVPKPKCIVNAKILIANTPMDTDKIKDSMVKIAELEVTEKEKMKDKVITRTRLVSVVAICSKVCIDVIARSSICRTRCRNISQGGKLLPNRNFAPKW